MKTAVSLPDDLFQQAERMARRLGLSRSGLFAAAVAEFVARHQDRRITEQLDRVYAAEASTVSPALRRAQACSLGHEPW